jgi:hypothetical protein
VNNTTEAISAQNASVCMANSKMLRKLAIRMPRLRPRLELLGLGEPHGDGPDHTAFFMSRAAFRR